MTWREHIDALNICALHLLRAHVAFTLCTRAHSRARTRARAQAHMHPIMVCWRMHASAFLRIHPLVACDLGLTTHTWFILPQVARVHAFYLV